MGEEPVIHIAIADDHNLFRQGVIQILNGFENFKVDIEVSNGKQLIEKLSNGKNRIDICIFEINMPEMNGYNTLKGIKEQWPDMKVLILSGYNNEFAIIKLLRDGANGYLLKSCNAFELRKALNSIYTIGIYYPELISGRLINLIQNRNKEMIIVLTDKEIEFLSLCSTKLSYKDIAKIMYVSPRTVDKFSKVLFEKLNVNSRTALASFAFNIGLYTDINKTPPLN
jgi:two-component system, NarL family, invasion response regulator UvrY